MESTERKALHSITDFRIGVAVRRMRLNPQYEEICERHEKEGARIEELYQCFEKEELLFIRRYYEDETLKSSLESDEIYYQGLKDAINILKFLGVLSQEVSL